MVTGKPTFSHPLKGYWVGRWDGKGVVWDAANAQGSSTHWSVCPKATLSKCAAEMGPWGGSCTLFMQIWKHTDNLRTLVFLQGTWSIHGGVWFTDSSVRCAPKDEIRGATWIHWLIMIFPMGIASWGGQSLPFSAVLFPILCSKALEANAEKQVCAERDILSMSCPQCCLSGRPQVSPRLLARIGGFLK